MNKPGISDRRYGYQFGAAMSFLALIAWWRGWWPWLMWTLVALAIFHLVLAAIAPQTLGLINRAWMGFGHVIGRIVAPIVLGLMFLLLITPTAIFFRLRGRDELKLRVRSGDSYWIVRKEPKLVPESFQRQY